MNRKSDALPTEPTSWMIKICVQHRKWLKLSIFRDVIRILPTPQWMYRWYPCDTVIQVDSAAKLEKVYDGVSLCRDADVNWPSDFNCMLVEVHSGHCLVHTDF